MNTAKRFKTLTAAAVLLAAAAVLVLAFLRQGYYLTLKNADSGEVYARWSVQPGERFSVEFIHSVNKTPVRDVYEIRGKDGIYVVETIYYDFGAGVQTELQPGESLDWGEDGSMIVSGIDTPIPRLLYFVGTVSDHTLRIRGQEISLRQLCGRSSNVEFSCDWRLF